MAWPDIQAPSEISAKYIKKQHTSRTEIGRPLTFAAHTRGRWRWKLSWDDMSQADFDLLIAAFEADQGGKFSWTHPLSQVAYTVGYVGDGIDHVLSAKRNDRYQVSCELEEK